MRDFRSPTDRCGHAVTVTDFDPPNGDDPIVVVGFDGEEGDKRPTILMLTPEMAAQLARKIAIQAEVLRRFKAEAQS